MEFVLPVILILFPIYSWCAFAAVYGLLTLLKFSPSEIDRLFKTKGVYIHAILLLPLLLLGVVTIPSSQLGMLTGLRLQLILWIALSSMVGIVLFYIYVLLLNLTSQKSIEKINIYLNKTRISFLLIVLPFIEDFLWRGILITFFTDLGLHEGFAVVLSAVSFGMMHYYFGGKEIIFKSFEGLFYGILFLASKSFISSGFAHLIYNHLVYSYESRKPKGI